MTPNTLVSVFVPSFIQQIFTEYLLCASIILGADNKLSRKEINKIIQMVLRAMTYSGNKSREEVPQVETGRSLVLGGRGQSHCGCSWGVGGKESASGTSPVSSHSAYHKVPSKRL